MQQSIQHRPGNKDLVAAAWHGDLESVRKLLSPENVNKPNARGQSALFCACRQGHSNVVLEILNFPGVNIDYQVPEHGGTALHAAVFVAHQEIIALLLAKGVNEEVANKVGITARQEAGEKPKQIFKLFDEEGVQGLTKQFPILSQLIPRKVPTSVVIEILEGKNLFDSDKKPVVNPHCFIFSNKTLLHKTHCAQDKKTWDSQCLIKQHPNPKITLEVWDWKNYSRSDFVGSARITSLYLAALSGRSIEVWVQLKRKGVKIAGSVHLVLHFDAERFKEDPCYNTVLDEILSQNFSPQSCEAVSALIPQVFETFRGPKDMKRKDQILSALAKYNQLTVHSRYTLTSILDLPVIMINLLDRNDYLSVDVQKFILSMIVSFRGNLQTGDADRLETVTMKMKMSIIECGLFTLQKLVWSPDLDSIYTRTLEIIRFCIIPETRPMIFSALVPIILSKISLRAVSGTTEDSFKKVLQGFIDPTEPGMSERLGFMSCKMLAAFVQGKPYNMPLPTLPITPKTRAPFMCPFRTCSLVFQEKQMLSNHFVQHKEESRMVIEDPKILASLVVSVEKTFPELRGKIESWLGADTFFLPNRTHKLWQEPSSSSVPSKETWCGVDDLKALTLIFSGRFPASELKKMTYKQIFYYIFFILNNPQTPKETMRATWNIISGTPSLAHHVYMLNLTGGFAPNSPISLVRVSSSLEGTPRWFDENLNLGTGKTRMQAGKHWTGLDLVDPLGIIKKPVTQVKLVKIFTSNAKPLLISLNPHEENLLLIFKRGDDLRQDYMVQGMFFLFNRLWLQSNIPDKPFIYQYRIGPMGSKFGVIEFVPDCEPSGVYNWKNLNSSVPSETQLSVLDKRAFILSMVGSYIACWVLGIRDRHQDNMMIKDNKLFFHIDFGFVFNNRPGFDAPIFSIPNEFCQALSPDEWNFFLQVCGDAFVVLHRNYDIILQTATMSTQGLPKIPTEQVRKCLTSSLMVAQSETAAKQRIKQLVQEGATSTQKEMKYLMHDIAQGGITNIRK
eukprot:TRINITY_DN3157_c0_g2_i2.p1 TRINITY_DN3157_c0_g2~~TRINITY_DN3157_c0_g2_i2.p1  ORF type:complete len:1021 (+),score=177.01 TRINITY_DN3157_c0_g2_i2:24-3065(+)